MCIYLLSYNNGVVRYSYHKKLCFKILMIHIPDLLIFLLREVDTYVYNETKGGPNSSNYIPFIQHPNLLLL